MGDPLDRYGTGVDVALEMSGAGAARTTVTAVQRILILICQTCSCPDVRSGQELVTTFINL
jgi:hypothetical protein